MERRKQHTHLTTRLSAWLLCWALAAYHFLAAPSNLEGDVPVGLVLLAVAALMIGMGCAWLDDPGLGVRLSSILTGGLVVSVHLALQSHWWGLEALYPGPPDLRWIIPAAGALLCLMGIAGLPVPRLVWQTHEAR
ncbi:hypothetical protein HNR42_001966 [Deinobacterium chartae]|uniref:Uncharacterized protein n=1 Tax=Deinobacterium chartae TaxID=521158 RepID=A0A841I3C7_9DEIO|nr:hypothetical protein [Deinobacterium chartae]MBB6098532.1 hypothetical protein [Deinobacterium chartae]